MSFGRDMRLRRVNFIRQRAQGEATRGRCSDVCLRRVMFALRASDVRLWRENYIRQRVLGGGTKTHAGANAGMTRTEAKKYCPERSFEAEQ